MPTLPEISVTGNAVQINGGDATPSSTDGTDFGSVLQGQPAPTLTFTVKNDGGSALTIGTVLLPPGFSPIGQLPFSLAWGDSASFTVTLNTASAGTFFGQINFSNNDGNETPFNFSIIGTVTPLPTRIISLSGNLAFGNVTVGTSAQRTLTVANNGNSTLTVSGISYPSGFSGDWPSGTIAAGGSQPVTVTFAPTSVTSYGNTLAVSANQTSGNNTYAISGTGVPAPAVVALNPSNLDQVYDGSPKVVTASTTPPGLALTITYSGSATLPTTAGTYPVVATVNDPNYTGSASGTLTINKATATVVLNAASLNQAYNGSPKVVTANTTPSGLSVAMSYNGGGTPPTAVGSYPVTATVNDPNYSGLASGTLMVGPAALIITANNGSKAYGQAVTFIGTEFTASGLQNSETVDRWH